MVKKEQIDVDSLYTESPEGCYWYENGINKKAVYALILAGLAAIAATFVVTELANYALFIGGVVSALSYRLMMSSQEDRLESLTPVEQE